MLFISDGTVINYTCNQLIWLILMISVINSDRNQLYFEEKNLYSYSAVTGKLSAL